MSPIQIVLVSAHPLWLYTCRHVLESSTRNTRVIPVVVDGGGGSGLNPDLVRALSTHPHIVMVSLDLPSGGLNFVRTLRAAGYSGVVLVLCSRYALPGHEELAASGVQGIITSIASLEELAATVYAAADGKLEPLLQQYLRIVRALTHQRSQRVLNDREREILDLVAGDLTDQEIAERLNVSVRTVNNHLRHVYAKLQVRGRAGAVATAIMRGMIRPAI